MVGEDEVPSSFFHQKSFLMTFLIKKKHLHIAVVGEDEDRAARRQPVARRHQDHRGRVRERRGGLLPLP